MIAGLADGHVSVYNHETLGTFSFQSHSSQVNEVKLVDQNHLVTCSGDNGFSGKNLAYWDLASSTSNPVWKVGDGAFGCTCAVLLSDNKIVATGNGDHQVRTRSILNNSYLAGSPYLASPVRSLYVHKTVLGDVRLIVGIHNKIYILQPAKLTIIQSITAAENVNSFTALNSNDILAAALDNAVFQFYKLDTSGSYYLVHNKTGEHGGGRKDVLSIAATGGADGKFVSGARDNYVMF